MENEESGGEDSRGVSPVSLAKNNSQNSVKFYNRQTSFSSPRLGKEKEDFSFLSLYVGNKKPASILVAGAVLLVVAVLGTLLYRSQDQYQLTERYTLVPDKISQSAPITVMLPEDTAFPDFDPARSLTFSPEIRGAWKTAASGQKNTYQFLPAQKLAVGTYHLVTLDTPELKMEKMFLVDNDPTVLAVFPKQETEVNEYSSVTIMFSRPMVPLSTLGENADVIPLVEINPKTEGRFKWVTTRTLQFIPKVRLFRSSVYTVSVKEGMTSLEGVEVPAFSRTFTTRALNYRTPDQNQGGAISLQHDRPLRIYFNQPFDLEKTRQSIALSSLSTNLPRSFVATYGTRIVSDEKTGKTRTLTDQSVLDIFLEKDAHGRSYLWDFGETYRVVVSGAVPLEGDVKLATPMDKSFSIAPVIESVTAQSSRSNLVTPEVFDPTGTLTFRISEPVDLSASDIVGKGITKIAYGQKCEEPAAGREVYVDSQSCKKIDDQESIVVSFDAQVFGMKETSSVMINKLVNSDGIILNTSPLTQQFTTFQRFEIVRTMPPDKAEDGSLTQIRICSTVPITTPSDEDFYKKVRSNMMIGLWNWDNSFLVTFNGNQPQAYQEARPFPENCPVGTFQTTIRYGLVPKFAYELTLDLADHFGRQLTKTIRFTTRDADPLAKGFSHLQPTVVMTPPERTILTYGLDFMNEVDMTICKVTAPTMLRYRAFPPNIQSGHGELDCLERKTDHLTLPESYATRKYLQVDLRDYYPSPIGNYVVVFSNPDYRRVSRSWESGALRLVLGERLFEKTYVTVTTLAVGSKQVERGDNYFYSADNREWRDSFMKGKWPTNLYWVNNFKNLSAVYGALVTPYVKGNEMIIRLPSQKTDIEGIAETPSADNVVGAVVTLGDDSAVVSNGSDALSWVQHASPARREYVYTDRPIYRPGDTVHIKGISRIGYDARFEVPTGETTLEVRNAKYEIAQTEKVEFSKNGTYEMSFTIDRKAPLGYYSMSSHTGGYGSFRVEEYVAPEFKVNLSSDKEEYISGETATVNIAADYYFGVPVENGNAEYRIVAQDYYFDRYHDEYFSFGRSWYENQNGWYGDRFVTSGILTLEKNGKGVIKEELNIDKLFTGNYRNQSKVVSIYVTVKNENGRSVTNQRSFIVHRGTFYAGLTMDDYFTTEGREGVARFKTVDIKGRPVQKMNLELTLDKVEWKSYKRQEVDGNFYYRTERAKTKVSNVKVSTDGVGDGSYRFTAGAAGEYEFTITGADELGNTVAAQYSFYVSGRGAISVRPTNNATLELVAERTDLSVGDTGSFVLKSPYARAKALVTLARGNTYEHKVIDIDSQLTRYQFAVTEQHIPNIIASVLLLSPLPEVKYGEVNYTVGTKEKELRITIMPEKKSYLPGEKVKLGIEVKDGKGNPVQAELSLAVVDMSVLALVGNPKKNPVTFFYNGEPLTIRTAMNVKNVLNVAEIPVGTKGGSGGGGDDLEKQKRGIFRDTAYWEGAVLTDASGKASAEFTLPDNLTEWRVESVGITKDTKIGAGYGDFVARKSVMVAPLKPRFIIPGDSFAVGGTIFNETDTTQKLKVSVAAPTLTLSGKTETTVVIEPHTSVSVSFPAIAPESIVSGEHEFTLSAKNNSYQDVVSSSFPIERNDTYEFTATVGRVTDANWKEQLYLPKNVVPNRGSLTVSLSATMASILDSAIRGMIVYPYEGNEQVASKLRTIAVVKQNAQLFGIATLMLREKVMIGDRTLTIEEIVQNGLAKLYQNQTPDGGMPYYANLPPDFRVTLATLETYNDLKKAGYAVDENKLTQAAQYIFNYINYPRAGYQLTSEDIITSSYVLSKLKNGALTSSAIRAKLIEYASNTALARNLSTPALAYLAILSTQEQFGAESTGRLFAEFENRSNIDARGTTVKQNPESPSRFTENAVVNTALALKAFSEAKRETPLLEGYLRAIKTGKGRDGGWGSTFNTIDVIDAMTEYLKWKNEANARMNVSATLDKEPLLSAEFTKTNILDTYAVEVSMEKLKRGASQTVEFLKRNLGTANDAYYYDMLLRYYLPTASISPRDEGFSVRRELYAQDDTAFARPVGSATQGQVLHGRVIISVGATRFHVAIEDFIPAGTEIVNQRFAIEDQGLGERDNNQAFGRGMGIKSGVKGDTVSRFIPKLASIFFVGGEPAGPDSNTDGMVSDDMYGNKNTTLQTLYPSAVENHDDRIFAYIAQLPPGEYVYDYYLRALIPGEYQYLPLVVREMYTPENFGRTAGSVFTVVKK